VLLLVDFLAVIPNYDFSGIQPDTEIVAEASQIL